MNALSRLATVALLFPLTAFAGTWGSGKWGKMYWGNNAETAPVATPTDISIESGPGEFKVTFSFDGSNGNDGWYLVDQYTVTCTNASNPDDQVSVSGSATTVLVEDLEPGETYACTVLASNEIGAGDPSDPVQAESESSQGLNLMLINAALCAKDPNRAGCPQA